MFTQIFNIRSLSLLFLAASFALTSLSAHARIIDWVGFITNKSVEITNEGFDTESLEIALGEKVVFYNESGRQLRVVSTGAIKLQTPPIQDGESARLRFPRIGAYELFCDKPCTMSMKVIVTRD